MQDVARIGLAGVFAMVMACMSGCGGVIPPPLPGPQIDGAYESCVDGDACYAGLTCTTSTLPSNDGYTGEFCTSGCNVSSDCAQDLSNYASICVNSQCYTQCPDGGGSCPYGTGCITFTDQNGDPINLCTP
jgi:hypothetical protein